MDVAPGSGYAGGLRDDHPGRGPAVARLWATLAGPALEVKEAMPLLDHGKKFMCFKCGTKFYDLHKDLAVCPSCGADQADRPETPAPVRAATFASARTSLVAAERSVLATDDAEDTEEVAEDEDIVGDIGAGEEEEEEEEEEESADDDDED